jgi:hypothetical protein
VSKVAGCPFCGKRYKNIFEVTDHLLERNTPRYDPVVTVKGGHGIKLGTLLRLIYKHQNNPEEINRIAQILYGTLYENEKNPTQTFHQTLHEVRDSFNRTPWDTTTEECLHLTGTPVQGNANA